MLTRWCGRRRGRQLWFWRRARTHADARLRMHQALSLLLLKRRKKAHSPPVAAAAAARPDVEAPMACMLGLETSAGERARLSEGSAIKRRGRGSRWNSARKRFAKRSGLFSSTPTRYCASSGAWRCNEVKKDECACVCACVRRTSATLFNAPSTARTRRRASPRRPPSFSSPFPHSHARAPLRPRPSSTRS